MDKFGIPWKAILGFLTVFGGQLWARAVVNGVPVIPDTPAGWAALLGGSFIAAVGIYLKSNLYTVPQAEANLANAVSRGRHARPDTDFLPPERP